MSRNRIEQIIGAPKRVISLSKLKYQLGREYDFSENAKKSYLRDIRREYTPIEIYWPWKNKSTQLYRNILQTYTIYEVGLAISPEGHYSHYSALFLHNLINQVPTAHVMSTEIKSRSSIHSREYDSFIVERTFMAPARKTKNVCQHLKDTITFLETTDQTKQYLDTILIEDEIEIPLTDLERTLIEAIESPHHCGGILTVISAWNKAVEDLNIEKLIEVYKSKNYFYPYWQRVGLLLDKLSATEKAKRWAEEFGTPKHEFYLDRQFKLEWEMDEKWKLRYPKEAF